MGLSPNQKIAAGAFAAVALLGVAVWALRERPPTSLASAFEREQQEFAGDYFVLLPLATGSRLGLLARDLESSQSRRLTVDPNPCFFTPPPERQASLSKLEVKYASKQAFSAELAHVVSGNVDDDGAATLVLTELSVANALGVLNPNGPCKGDGTYSIVTGEIIAGTAELSSARALAARATAKTAPLATPSAIPSGATLRSDWSQSNAHTVTARNLVLGGKVQRVRVQTLARRGAEDLTQGVSLGENPVLGRRENLPDGITGHVVIGSYSFTERWLELTLNLPLNAQAAAPAGLKTCTAGAPERLALGRECYYLVGTGNVLLAVSWTLDAESRVRLYLSGFRTEYAE